MAKHRNHSVPGSENIRVGLDELHAIRELVRARESLHCASRAIGDRVQDLRSQENSCSECGHDDRDRDPSWNSQKQIQWAIRQVNHALACFSAKHVAPWDLEWLAENSAFEVDLSEEISESEGP